MADLSDWLQLAQAIQPWPGAAESIAAHWQRDLALLAKAQVPPQGHFETKMGDFGRLLQP